MKIVLPSILRKALPTVCMLGLSSLLTGCGPDGNEPLFPSVHTASYTGATAIPPTPDHRFSHQRPAPRSLQASRNAPPQGPVAIN